MQTLVLVIQTLALIVSVATLVCSIVVYVKLRKSLSDCETRNSVDLNPILREVIDRADAGKAAKDHWEVMKEIRDKKIRQAVRLGATRYRIAQETGITESQIGRIVR